MSDAIEETEGILVLVIILVIIGLGVWLVFGFDKSASASGSKGLLETIKFLFSGNSDGQPNVQMPGSVSAATTPLSGVSTWDYYSAVLVEGIKQALGIAEFREWGWQAGMEAL